MNWVNLLKEIKENNFLAIARAISLVENEVEGHMSFLKELPNKKIPIIGITGPPGAGKSTLVDALISEFINSNKKVAILCIDPSSPFNMGALLGDRIRMSDWYNNPNVFIRSLATRGSLGGLHPKIIEITDILKSSNFDYIIIETVGVGQSEIEIVGLADTTVVVLVPEAGDEIQTMKAGLMEIANIFVVNKADRPEADVFVRNLRQMLAPVYNNTNWEVPIIKTQAHLKVGVKELTEQIAKYQLLHNKNDKQAWLLTQKAYHLIQHKKMSSIQKEALKKSMEIEMETLNFNIYKFIEKYE
jgi:LAO/AO transport system kinase